MEAEFVSRDEIQTAAGNLLAELQNVCEDYRKGRIVTEEYHRKVLALKLRYYAFKAEFAAGSCGRTALVAQYRLEGL